MNSRYGSASVTCSHPDASAATGLLSAMAEAKLHLTIVANACITELKVNRLWGP